jgi:cytochrome b involved in lipid metabolism
LARIFNVKVFQAIEELDCVDPDAKVQVEINGVVHDVHKFYDDSQGAYFVVDLDIEEKEMR